ncbi:MAG: PDZ domain-containing protein [Candidatus Obscuribacterales bacterium]|jgi:carboxyl-terminal processing protease|nr:PDZ domain-containing protein [Candidatus Obscuribacterales bacterium]
MSSQKNERTLGQKVMRGLKIAGIGLSVMLVLAGAAGFYLYDQYFYATPVELYHRTWDTAQRSIYDPKDLGDWKQWEHKFDSEIVTNEDAVKRANEMLASAKDRYTMLLNPEQADAERRQMEGKFIGIGITFDFQVTEAGELVLKDGKPVATTDAAGYPMIDTVLDNSPAAKAGIQAGDALKSVKKDGKDVDISGKPLTDVVQMLRGKEGESVDVVVVRDGKDIPLTITRQAVIQHSVETKMLDNGIGYLRLKGFDQYKNLDEVIEGMKKLDDAKGIIFDLRGNPGGLVPNAISISSLFVEKGTLVVIKHRISGDPANPQYKTVTYRVEGDKLITETSRTDREGVKTDESARAPYMLRGRPVVILTDGGTASASEMTTGALRDNDVAEVLGERSVGKGIGQSVMPFANGTILHITSLRYFTPSGKWLGDGGNTIKDGGIEPDHKVKANKKRFKHGSKDDNQLEAAVELMGRKLEQR